MAASRNLFLLICHALDNEVIESGRGCSETSGPDGCMLAVSLSRILPPSSVSLPPTAEFLYDVHRGSVKKQAIVQDSAKRLWSLLVKPVVAFAYHFCLSLPAVFTQPGRSLLADPCTDKLCECDSDRGGGLQGSANPQTPGSENKRIKSCVLLPAAGRRSQSFSPHS